MNIIHVIVLAIIEGLTEFLPVSSTGHLVVASALMGIGKDEFVKLFEIVIQLGAILAVVVLYWKKFLDFKSWHFYLKLIIAVLPALVLGFLLSDKIDALLESPLTVAITLLLGGIILLFIDKVFTTHTVDKEESISNSQAFRIGIWQCIAMIPGVSRSAATIIGGMSQKLTRNLAAEFSFFLAVPTMLAASVKSFYDALKDNYLAANNITPEQADTVKVHLGDVFAKANLNSLFTHDNLMAFIIGAVVSFIVALIAVKFFISYLQKHGFKMFGWYRIIVGAVMLALIFSKVI